MARVFRVSDIDPAWDEGELAAVVRARGYTKTGVPTIWGEGFAKWYFSGGREELARARRGLLRAMFVGVR